MASTRERIRMDGQERVAFLAEPHKMSLATINADGTPHLVTMYYAMQGVGEAARMVFWTYATSQKAVNLDRDPRCSVLVETGDGYENLRGVSITGTVTRIEDQDAVLEIGQAVYGRYVDFDVTTGPMLDFLRQQATKRSAYALEPTTVATWDHRKLAEGVA